MVALALVPKDGAVSFYADVVARLGGPTLILGSAKGGLAWELGARGTQVVGVEPSARMLEIASARAAGEPQEVVSRVRFLEADVRALRLPDRFQTVLAPNNAFGLLSSFKELEAFVATALHHLAPGGAFAFDLALPGTPPLAPPPEPASRPTPWLEPPRPVFVPHLRERSASRQGALHRLRLRQFALAEIDAALLASGFSISERYGGFAKEPYGAGRALAAVVAIRPERRG